MGADQRKVMRRKCGSNVFLDTVHNVCVMCLLSMVLIQLEDFGHFGLWTLDIHYYHRHDNSLDIAMPDLSKIHAQSVPRPLPAKLGSSQAPIYVEETTEAVPPAVPLVFHIVDPR